MQIGRADGADSTFPFIDSWASPIPRFTILGSISRRPYIPRKIGFTRRTGNGGSHDAIQPCFATMRPKMINLQWRIEGWDAYFCCLKSRSPQAMASWKFHSHMCNG